MLTCRSGTVIVISRWQGSPLSGAKQMTNRNFNCEFDGYVVDEKGEEMAQFTGNFGF